MLYRSICLAGLILGGSPGSAFAVEAGTLRVATVKVDITPDEPAELLSVYQTQFTGIHDRTYARGIVIDNGITSAAIISFDAVEVADGTAMLDRIASETGIPISNIILTATHDHTAPMIGLHNADGNSQGGPGVANFVAKVENDLIAALKQAKTNARPARIGFGQGSATININRDLLTSAGKYVLGDNPDGPSDKAVRIVKFESLTGEPIAMLINYAVHSTVLGAKASLVTGELAGATARIVEDRYKGKVVAIYALGAAGDQAPIVRGPESTQPNSERNFAVVDVLGQILGAEAIRVAEGIRPADAKIKLWGADKVVSCPGQKAVNSTTGGERILVDSEPVKFRLGVLMIDQMAITSVSAEVVTNIYLRLREQSPFANTMMITLANGRIGYIAQDVSYDNPTFEVYGSPLKKGCGESTIVNGLLDIMKQY